MKDGFVQQVDTPQNLYDYPANLFVAGFIGSPQMNFFNVKLSKEGHDVVRYLRRQQDQGARPARCPSSSTRATSARKSIMGIRPENIHDEPVFLQTLRQRHH